MGSRSIIVPAGEAFNRNNWLSDVTPGQFLGNAIELASHVRAYSASSAVSVGFSFAEPGDKEGREIQFWELQDVWARARAVSCTIALEKPSDPGTQRTLEAAEINLIHRRLDNPKNLFVNGHIDVAGENEPAEKGFTDRFISGIHLK